jgi:dTDP-4-dehydrorhamnose reductase
VDVRDADAVARLVGSFQPDAIVHTAYIQDGPDAASTIVDGSAAVATCAAEAGARLVHLSTDLVFSGRAGRPYREHDEPDPIVDYGRLKLAAEHAVAELAPDALIERTSLLYGAAAPGRQERMALDAADGRSDVGFYLDELRCPTAVPDLAAALVELAARPIGGVLHAAGPQALSRYELARMLAHAGGRSPDAIRAADRSAGESGRPTDCRLDSSRAESLLGTRIRGVSEVLADA